MSGPLTLETVYQSEFRFVWRILGRLGVPNADIPDAVQEVFLVVHRRLGEFDGRSKVTTWLYRICFNIASDRRRRAHVRHEVPCDDAQLDQIPEPTRSAFEDLALFDRMLDGMTMEQRAVFVLFEVEGYKGQDIAEMMDCPLATVYSRLRIARATFARAVERYRASWSRARRAAL